MDIKMLEYKYHINTETGFNLRYVKSDTEYFRPHYHNYYEIFLVVKGSVEHYINGATQILSPGSLLFIRDFDIHHHTAVNGNYFEHINMAFRKEIFEELMKYLGKGFSEADLLSAKYSPYIQLMPRECEKIMYSLLELNTYTDPTKASTQMRIQLMNILTKYFQDYVEEKTEIPLWLEIMYEKMKRPDNFIAGAKRMTEISGKSREHVSRMLKKYYNISPNEYVNELRLNHALNLMMTSNLNITEICFECGFSNLSWFYSVFQKKFKKSPSRYRNDIKKIFSHHPSAPQI